VHAVDFLNVETINQSVVEHGLAAAAAFFGGLKDDDGCPREITALREIARRSEQHRGMTVMAASVHLARRRRSVGQIGRLLDRQGVHVGA